MRKLLLLLFLISFCLGYGKALSESKVLPAKSHIVMGTFEVQKVLNKLGYECPTTGVTDSLSVHAIRQFQADHNLTVDGIIGMNTQEELLKEFVCSTVSALQINNNSFGAKTLMYIEWYPDSSAEDPYYKDFYHIYVSNNQRVTTTIWSDLMVRKDFEKVLWGNRREATIEHYYTLDSRQVSKK